MANWLVGVGAGEHLNFFAITARLTKLKPESVMWLEHLLIQTVEETLTVN